MLIYSDGFYTFRLTDSGLISHFFLGHVQLQGLNVIFHLLKSFLPKRRVFLDFL